MKKLITIVPLVILLCFTFGCQDKAAMAELEEFRAQAALEEQNKEIVKGLVEEINKGNVEIFKELCAPEYAYYSASIRLEPMSLDETIEVFQREFKGFPDYNIKTHELIAKGDKVIARFTCTGTHEGEYYGIPASGNKIEFGVIDIFHIKEGKIVESREEIDSLGLARQLGMELKPKEVEK
ncbi:MAG: ester cyclase [Candidatus Hodarchaeota archaeon]